MIEKAFNRLRMSISPEDAKDFLNTTLMDVRSAAMAIQREQEGRKALKNIRRIQPFLDTVESYAKTIEILCQGFPPMSFVWVR